MSIISRAFKPLDVCCCHTLILWF